jgi:Family of unknown function (DUF5670)
VLYNLARLLTSPPGKKERMIRDFVFLVLFFILLGIWAAGWLAFHIAGGLIHLLLILAVVFLIAHAIRGRRPV